MKIEIKDIREDFIDIIKNINTEDIKIKDNSIIIEGDEISKLRAKINLLFRLIYIYNNFEKIFEK